MYAPGCVWGRLLAFGFALEGSILFLRFENNSWCGVALPLLGLIYPFLSLHFSADSAHFLWSIYREQVALVQYMG